MNPEGSNHKYKLLFFCLSFMISLQIPFPSLSHSFKVNTGNPTFTASSAEWESGRIESPSVLFDGTFKMWYAGTGPKGKKRIGFAFSSDGIKWTKYKGDNCPSISSGNGCVLDRGNDFAWDRDEVYGMTVVIDKDDPRGQLYKMWYTGAMNAVSLEHGRWRTGYAFSYNGIKWIKYESNKCLSYSKGAGCVFDAGTSGSWDEVVAAAPSVIIDRDAPAAERYRMWYEGCVYNNVSPEHVCRIGYATSPDGITWKRYGSNNCRGYPDGPGCVFDTGEEGTWDEVRVLQPVVIKSDGMFHMWYAGQAKEDNKFRIGYATSSDGIIWARTEKNLCAATRGKGCILDAPPARIKTGISDPYVINIKGNLIMWYRLGKSSISRFDLGKIGRIMQ
jgi:hypothetical protein